MLAYFLPTLNQQLCSYFVIFHHGDICAFLLENNESFLGEKHQYYIEENIPYFPYLIKQMILNVTTYHSVIVSHLVQVSATLCISKRSDSKAIGWVKLLH